MFRFGASDRPEAKFIVMQIRIREKTFGLISGRARERWRRNMVQKPVRGAKMKRLRLRIPNRCRYKAALLLPVRADCRLGGQALGEI